MSFWNQPVCKYTIRASAVVTLGLLVASCSESKLSQCKQLIDVANQVVTNVQTVAQNASSTTNPSDSLAVINKVAEAADQAKTDMESLQLSDENLKGFQTRYAAMYAEIGETTRDMLSAAQSKDTQAGKNAYNEFKAATSQEGSLVNEINAYCAQ
ncbi:MAG: hypothetical protein HC769_08490 [Cyanobacteria bacterium CRU_2_1]|nr:hypothetical protein [Cyanobacteria bacterium RU_5_0]NJR58882.1 hypothetical protein [Cyanobacteria bacterium CRU_2_1]